MDTIPLPLPDITSLLFQPGPVQMFWDQHVWAIKLLLLLLVGAGIFLFVRYRERKNRKLFVSLNYNDPTILRQLFDFEGNIGVSERLQKVIHQISDTRLAASPVLNIRKTVTEVARSGVLLRPVYDRHSQPIHYLFLLEEISFKDHRARVFDLIFQSFIVDDISVSRLFYANDMRNCRNEEYPNGLNLPQLLQAYPESRLILIGSGAQMFNFANGGLAKWSHIFDQWRYKAILSFVPRAQWGRRERLLAERFLLLPASINSFATITYAFESTDVHLEDITDDAWTTPITFTGDLIYTLSVHFNRKLLHWIAACAVYPNLLWGMTLFLGQLIAEYEAKDFNLEDLFELCRLPWFIEGEIPLEARTSLLNYLETQEPALLNKIRENILDLLANNPPPPDSLEFEEYQMVYAMNEWLITKDKQRKSVLERELFASLSARADPFLKVFEAANRPRTPMDFALPAAWQKYLYSGRSKFGLEFLQGAAIFLFISVCIFWFEPSFPKSCTGNIVELNNQSYCLERQEDAIRLNQHQVIRLAQEADFKSLDSLLSAVYHQADTAFANPISAVAFIACYNQGLRFRKAADTQSNGSASALEKSCYSFKQADKIRKNYLPNYRLINMENYLSDCLPK